MHHSAGFTIVEMIVTVVLAGIFLTFFIQMYRATNAQQLSLIRQSTANDIARSNLAKFPTAAALPTYVCSTTSSNNPNNLTINPNAPGTSIPLIAPTATPSGPGEVRREDTPDNLGTVTQEIRAFSPQGCGANEPIKILSRVTYGYEGQQNTVEYATYVF